jgi:hypothetical protein
MVTISPRGKRGGSPVISGTITLPRVGAWTATLIVDAAAPPAGPVDVTIDDRMLIGTVTDRSGVVEGVVEARIVGGADGLMTAVKAKHFTTPTVRNVLAHIAGDAGEALSAAGDSATLDLLLEHWTVLSMPAALAIRALLRVLPAGTVWRILADGGLWVGLDTFPDSGLRDVAIVGERAEDAMIELALEVPFLLPGTTVAGRKADTVELSFGAGGASARVWTVP